MLTSQRAVSRMGGRLRLPAPPEVGVPPSPFWDKETRSHRVTDEPTSQGRPAAGELQAWALAVTAAVHRAGAGLGGHSPC